MRIAFFSESYYPYISGVVRSIDLFSLELRKRGHEVFIFAPDYRECSEEEFVYRFPSVPTPNVPGFRLPIPYMPKLTEHMRSLDLDIIHTHTPFLMGRLSSALAKKLHLPLVFTYHTKYEHLIHYVPFARKTARKITVKLTRDYCERCNAVVAPSNHVKQMLTREGVSVPVEVIPTGVELEKFAQGNRNWLRRRYRFSENDEVLLYVGRLGEEKNLDLLFDVFKELLASRPNLYLVLVGGGSAEEEFRQQVQKEELENRIIFSGVVSPRKVVDYYLGADIFVFPSVNETQGLVLLEAMAAGLPAVAMNREGPASVIDNKKDGLLVSPRKENFKMGILKLLENPEERHVMGKEAYKKACSLSSKVMAEKMENLYKRVLQEKSLRMEPTGSQD